MDDRPTIPAPLMPMTHRAMFSFVCFGERFYLCELHASHFGADERVHDDGVECEFCRQTAT